MSTEWVKIHKNDCVLRNFRADWFTTTKLKHWIETFKWLIQICCFFYCFYFVMYCGQFRFLKRVLMSGFGDMYAIIFNLKQKQSHIQIIQANQHNLRSVLLYDIKAKQQKSNKKTTKNNKNSTCSTQPKDTFYSSLITHTPFVSIPTARSIVIPCTPSCIISIISNSPLLT